MLLYALSFLFGIIVFADKSNISISNNEILVFTILSIFALILFWQNYKKASITIAMLLIGFAWMGFNSQQLINNNIENKFLNKYIAVEGVIASTIEQDEYRSKFKFNIESPFKADVRLSWYKNKNLKTGQRWQLLVKLKQNSGFYNPKIFDYEKWLFAKKFNAVGYVKNSHNNKLINQSDKYLLQQVRFNLTDFLNKALADFKYKGIIKALIIGDRYEISKDLWQLFTKTNTSHLTVISGLHIGIIAGFVFFITSFLWRRSLRLSLYIPSQIAASYSALLFAFIYAALAGFSVPTQRAFIMALVFFANIILKRNENIWRLYSYALILVLVVNPLSTLTVGFWLSFFVVGLILYTLHIYKYKPWYLKIILLQLIISIAMVPVLIWFFQTFSISSPLANIVAIPAFSFIITPIALIGALFNLLSLDLIAYFLFFIVDSSIYYLTLFLAKISQFNINTFHFNKPNQISFIFAIFAVLVLFLPKGLKLRRFAFILILPLFFNNTVIKKNNFKVTLLDSGQSLAMVIQTQNHNLIFDTGFSTTSGFNIGESVITPFLYANNIKEIDKIIVSHNDNDHSGGLKSLLKEFKTKEILTSAYNKIANSKPCYDSINWQWDGVLFEILSPSKNSNLKNNNASCVLKISNKHKSILITADIEILVENLLIENNSVKLKSDVLLVPHHGSKTSSSISFINAVSPEYALIANGYKNRFKLPAKSIVNKYKNNNSKIYTTACSGAITLLFSNKISLTEMRKSKKHFWNRQC